MVNNIVLKTFKGGSVTPQDDAIIYQTVLATNGIFKGCEVSYARGNILHISQGFGMIKGRFFEVYETEVDVQLNSVSYPLNGRVYIHMDLSNADVPIQILTETAQTLPELTGDEDVNYNNTSFDLELATFKATSTALSDLNQTFSKITGASGGSASSLQRLTAYSKGDFSTCGSAPGWVTLYCTRAGETGTLEPLEYQSITKIGDTVQDGTCVFTARDVIGELETLSQTLVRTKTDVKNLEEELIKQIDNRPAAIGSIKYSASQDMGAEWLRCDGSFINEADYPELVAALGKLTPGVEQFKSPLAEQSERGNIPTNCVVWNGNAYIYMVDTKKLVSITKEGTVKTISVSGADSLVAAETRPVVLSICTGGLYLCQLANDVSAIAVLECTAFSENAASISMTALNVAGKITATAPIGTYIWPEVVTVNGKQYMAVCTHTVTVQYYSTVVVAMASWTAGSFASTAAITTREWCVYCTYSQSSYPHTEYATLHSLLAYHHKNGGDMITAYHAIMGCNEAQWNGYAGGFQIYFVMMSYPQSLFGDTTRPTSPPLWNDFNGKAITDAQKNTVAWELYQYWFVNNKTIGFNVIPVAAQNECIYNAEIKDHFLTILSCCYNPRTMPEYHTVESVHLPSAARLGRDSITFADGQGMWFIFVGTGILFAESLETGKWGYLDTAETLGVVSSNQSIEYDSANNLLYVSGNTSNGAVVGQLALDDRFSYANDGAWLPMLASNGVPAYIKAKTEQV